MRPRCPDQVEIYLYDAGGGSGSQKKSAARAAEATRNNPANLQPARLF